MICICHSAAPPQDLAQNMEAVGVESADKLLIDRHFNDLEK
jgi:hypothetical protein